MVISELLEDVTTTSHFIKARLVGDTKKMADKAPKKTIYRRSDNGRITTKDYAERHPKTTEKERVRTGK